MCTPIGHTLAGAVLLVNQSVSGKINKVMGFLFLIIVANLPDIDYLFGFIAGNPNLYHHGWTHSLFFVLLSGSVGFCICCFIKREWAVVCGFIISGILLTHLVLDYFTIDTSEPYGMQVFWPISKGYFISPVTFLGDLYKSSSSATFIPSLFVWHNLKTVALETAIFLPLLTGVWIVKKKWKLVK